MAGNKFVPKKSTEVEAYQLNVENLGRILQRLKAWSDEAYIEFKVTFNNVDELSIEASLPHYFAILGGEYVVFDTDDFDVLSEAQFNEIFEPAPPEVTTQEWFYPPGQTPPGFSPYQPRPMPTDGIFPYEQAIVLD